MDMVNRKSQQVTHSQAYSNDMKALQIERRVSGKKIRKQQSKSVYLNGQ